MANRFIKNERMSEQAHIPHALTLFENAAHKNCQYHALVMANRTKKIFKYRIPNSFLGGCRRSYESAAVLIV